MGTENGPNSVWRQQSGILVNGLTPEPAMPQMVMKSSDVKPKTPLQVEGWESVVPSNLRASSRG